MARQQLDTTPNPGGDLGTVGGNKINANALLDDALQTATGIAEGDTNIGTLAGTTGALAPTDTLKEGVEKAANAAASALTTDSTRTQGDTSRTSRELGVDVDLDSLTAGTIGTTYMPAAGTNAAQYPQDDTLYEVDVRYSGASTPFADGDLITYTLTAEVSGEPYVWVATDLSGGGRSAWTQVAPVATLTESDSTRSTRSLATNADWLAETASGRYVVTYSSGNATGDSLAISSSASAAAITWTIDIYYNSATTGWAIAWCEHNLNGLGTKTHAFYAPLTRAGGDWNDPVADWVGVTAEDTADRAIRPEMLRAGNWTLTKPSEMTATLPAGWDPVLTRTGYSCTTSARANRPSVLAGTYYVDQVLGDDGTGDGSSGNPYASIYEAMTEADCGVIKVAPGIYGYDEGSAKHAQAGGGGSFPHTNNYILEPWAGIRLGPIFVTSHDVGSAWTLNSGRVWQITNGANTAGVVDLRFRDENGGYFTPHPVTSIAEAEAKPGSAYVDNTGGITYYHALDSREPNEEVLILRNTYAYGDANTADAREWYCDGITFIGGNGGFKIGPNGGGAGSKAIARNCRAINNGSAGFQFDDVEEVILDTCQAINNGADGIQYNETVASCSFLEINCTANFNKGGGSDNGNGTSAHDSCVGLRINTRCENNCGPQFADVDTSQSWNVGCYAGPAQMLDEDLNSAAGFYCRDASGIMVLTDCIAHGNYRDLSATNATARIYVYETAYATDFQSDDPNNVVEYEQY